MAKFCVVILAAGEGKRMKSALPKVLHALNGRPMISYVVEAARGLKPSKIIAVLGKKRPQVKEALDKDVGVAWQDEPRGTADALRAALPKIPAGSDDVVVLYGDTPLITTETLRSLYAAHREKNATCTVLSALLNNPRGYGRILRNDSGSFVGIVEDKDATAAQKQIQEVNTGMYCFRRQALFEALGHVRSLNKTGEFYLTDIFVWLLNRAYKIEACAAEDADETLGVNSRRELADAERVLRLRVLERFCENGVVIEDAATTFIDATAVIGEGTRVLPFTIIEKGVVIGRACLIGPFAHLREGTVLEDGVFAGNFTEIKNSTLGKQTRMSHVGYLGDTRVGRGVNIGAGCVVANFDGRKKYRTVIKDKAFVGCDAVLVAPVTVGKRAVVGAGAVVTRQHDVPDGATVAGVPAREIRKGKTKGGR